MFDHTCIKTSELNYFTVYLQENNRTADNGIHSHDEYELFILLEGELTYVIDGNDYRPAPVQVVVIPPHVEHRFIADTRDERKMLLRGIMIHFSVKEDAQPLFFKDMLSSPDIIDVRSYPEIIVLQHNITHYSYIFSDEEFAFLRHGLVCQLLLLLWKYSAFNISNGKNTNHLTAHVAAYINQHLTENLSLETVCGHFKFNKIYMNRIFKRDTGVTVHAYIQSRKMLLAKALIFGGEKPMQAMEKSGFTTYSSFYRLFVKTYGMSPNDMYVQNSKDAITSPYIKNITKKSDDINP